ncbi:MAG TPA: type II secretion system protein GspG [Candidatus Polarisedimenticolaceae bacterium]|nr:type II secretion system protein GspG [Candidatus Polarisedimenticolaceae bacterium]
MRILVAVIEIQAVEGAYPGPTEGLVPMSSLASVRGRGAAVRDAWNNPLLYWSDGRDYVIVSLGSDRTMQFDYAGYPPYANVPAGWAGSDPTNDLLIVDGFAYRGPASQAELLRRAMGEIRRLGTACESFAVDNNIYPGPVQPTDVVARIEGAIAPVYLRVLPKLDPWGHPYLFWSDTTHYAFVSYGPDGTPDFPYTTWGRAEYGGLSGGSTTRFGADLVFVDGEFVQWPAVVSQTSPNGNLRQAMADLRSAAIAAESFAIDNNVYPGPIQPIDSVARIEASVEPTYIRALPKVDPWGNPYLFWSDTTHYAVVSYGPDGIADFPYATWGSPEFHAIHTGITTRLGADLVFANGGFVQWPTVGEGP